MKKINFFKRFVLTGILLFSGYLGFAQYQQKAIFTLILPQDVSMHEVILELQYKRVEDDNWLNISYITPDWELYTENGVTKSRASYHLTGLEIDEVYQVRVRAYIIDGEYEPNEDMWSLVQITMPLDGSDGYWDIICRPVILNLTALNLLTSEVDVISNEEFKITQEAIKEE